MQWQPAQLELVRGITETDGAMEVVPLARARSFPWPEDSSALSACAFPCFA